jgi:Fe-S cluster assembly iron-binding protein IscA
MSAITITDAAHDYLSDLLKKQNTTGIGIRVFITQPGTSYAETCIAYCKPGEQKPEDTALALKEFTAWIDAVSEPFLEDAVVDYATDRMGGQLTIKAPNAKVPMVNEDRSTRDWPAMAARSAWSTWSRRASPCCASAVAARAAVRPTTRSRKASRRPCWSVFPNSRACAT